MSSTRKRLAEPEAPPFDEGKAPPLLPRPLPSVALSEDAFDIDPDELEAHLLAMDERIASNLPLAPLPQSPSGSEAPDKSSAQQNRNTLTDFLADPELAREFAEPFELVGPAGSSKEKENHVCQDCGSISYNVVFQKVFGLFVCNACRRAGSARDEAGQQTGKYALCIKGVAKDHFLLSDGDLASLPFISKPNPRKQSWGDMKLFLRSQVEAKSFEKYGDAAGLAAAKHKREVTRIERRLAANKRQRKKEAPARPYVPPPVHEHTFRRVEKAQPGGLLTEHCAECGLERTFEEF